MDESTKNKITYNLCGSSTKTCNGHNNVHACIDLHRSNEQKILGYNQSLHWENGRIHFDFKGELCKDNLNYSLTVLLECAYGASESTLFPSVRTFD